MVSNSIPTQVQKIITQELSNNMFKDFEFEKD